MPDPAAILTARLTETMLADARRLRARIARARERRATPEQWAALAAEVDAAAARLAERAGSRPTFAYPPELPVSARAGKSKRRYARTRW